jgi:putative hydrolase of the HAD superfamily
VFSERYYRAKDKVEYTMPAGVRRERISKAYMKNNGGRPQYKYILFDLDDTLYPREAGLMKAIGERILLYMVHRAGIPADDAPLKRLHYHQQFGTTLRGLMNEYNIDPADFLAFVHDLNPRDYFGASPPLHRMLEAIPLRKVIFTSADVPHCRRVLETLQVLAHFDMIIDIQATNFQCKPDPLVYKHVLQLLNAPGESCIMVEDSPRNLIPAKDLGMTTILVAGDEQSPAVDYAVPTIFHVEQVLRKLLPDTLTR